MKIAFVSEHASPLAAVGGVDAGGQNVLVAGLARQIGMLGHEVTVYTRRDSPFLPPRAAMCEGVTVEHVPAGPPRELPKDDLLPHMTPFAAFLGERWRRDRPTVAHAHFWMSGLAAPAAADDLHIPVVQTFHALGVVKKRHQGAADTSPRERIQLEAAIGRCADAVIATCSDEVFELARMGVPRTSISVVPCGVDVGLFRPAAASAPLRTGRAPTLLAAGRLVERKGVDTILRALPEIPGVALTIAGGPPRPQLRGDPEYRRLAAIASEVNVADRVTFLGRVPHDEMPAVMRGADLVISVPWYEPFGMVPVEAMACGVPVVVSAVGGHTDSVVESVTGTLVPPKQPRLLARRVRELLDAPATLRRFGRAGAARVRAHYSWERIAHEHLAVYARACRARERRRGAQAPRRASGGQL
jgi:D-inositol-3-phosphate glycosyltransferase